MVRYDFRQRYPSASEALQALKGWHLLSGTVVLPTLSQNTPAAVQNKPIKLTKTLSGFNLIRVNRTGYAAVSITNIINSSNATALWGNTLYDLKRYKEASVAYKTIQIKPVFWSLEWSRQYVVWLETVQSARRLWQSNSNSAWVFVSLEESRFVLDNLQRYEERLTHLIRR